MKSNLSVIITLFKTPANKLKSLKQYKNHPILIFDQATTNNSKQIYEDLNVEFEYFHSQKNIGLPKSTNFLISKVKTKYCLFTQADVAIDKISIDNLIKGINLREDIIFAGPIFEKNRSINTKMELKENYKLKSKLDASIMICDVKKVKEIGFFDEDYFLYWEDKDLMERVSKSNFKMIQILNSFATHDGANSTIDSTKVKFIRKINFKYGELLFDLKHKELSKIKILRQILINVFFLPINIIILSKTNIIDNISQILGIIKFIKFLLLKKPT